MDRKLSMRHQGFVQKDFYLPERTLNVSLFFSSTCLGTGKGRLILVYFDPNLVSHSTIVKTIVIIWKAGAIQEMVCKLQLKKMCQISLTRLCRSEGIWVDLHIFTQISIRD